MIKLVSPICHNILVVWEIDSNRSISFLTSNSSHPSLYRADHIKENLERGKRRLIYWSQLGVVLRVHTARLTKPFPQTQKEWETFCHHHRIIHPRQKHMLLDTRLLINKCNRRRRQSFGYCFKSKRLTVRFARKNATTFFTVHFQYISCA